MEKKKVFIDLAKLTDELQVVYDETYPTGIAGKTIRFPNSKGEIVTAVRIETDDTIYLVKVMAKPKEVLTEEQMDAMVKSQDSDKELEEEAKEEEEEEDTKDSDGAKDED